MTPEQVDRRVMKSRQTHSAMAQAFSAGHLSGPLHEHVAMLTAEIVILRQLAVEYPDKARKITAFIEKVTAFRDDLKRGMD